MGFASCRLYLAFLLGWLTAVALLGWKLPVLGSQVAYLHPLLGKLLSVSYETEFLMQRANMTLKLLTNLNFLLTQPVDTSVQIHDPKGKFPSFLMISFTPSLFKKRSQMLKFELGISFPLIKQFDEMEVPVRLWSLFNNAGKLTLLLSSTGFLRHVVIDKSIDNNIGAICTTNPILICMTSFSTTPARPGASVNLGAGTSVSSERSSKTTGPNCYNSKSTLDVPLLAIRQQKYSGRSRALWIHLPIRPETIWRNQWEFKLRIILVVTFPIKKEGEKSIVVLHEERRHPKVDSSSRREGGDIRTSQNDNPKIFHQKQLLRTPRKTNLKPNPNPTIIHKSGLGFQYPLI